MASSKIFIKRQKTYYLTKHYLNMKIQSIFSFSLVFLLYACSSYPKDVYEVDTLPDIYPDYIGVTIPTNIAPLNFSMTDDSVTTIYVEIKGSKGGEISFLGSFADFDINDWHHLTEENKGGKLLVSVCAEKEGKWTKYREFPIFVSIYKLNDWGITYRRIAPGYKMYGHMGIYQRDLSSYDEIALLDNKELDGECINCHTPNRTNPEEYVFHVRGEHGATVISHQGINEALKSSNDCIGGTMVYPYWHPDGRYCAFSTNKTSQLFHSAINKRIEVFDFKSDVFVYDSETHDILRDTLLMKNEWAENCPAFSPDGKWLYFTTAFRQVYPKDYQKEKYSLCRISFNSVNGKFGNKVDTLISAYLNGKSASWPRPSYDGRYLMYTQLDYGYFSVWHPEADLWLMDLQTGKVRPLEEVNSDESDSFHNWSSDSHWFLFTSRRNDGLYTQVFFASIDEKGKATKPFLLPQKNPKYYYNRTVYSFNTPDFSSSSVKEERKRIKKILWDDRRI